MTGEMASCVTSNGSKNDSSTENNLINKARKDPNHLIAPQNRKKLKKHEEKFIPAPPKYIFSNGYRLVQPYVYEFRTYTKERCFKKKLIDVFKKEFGAYPPEYYLFAIKSGRITVNEQIVKPEYELKNGDLIVHKTHRHEPPVNGEEIKCVYENEDVLIVSKPPSIATHPCGAYRHNSLHSIVQYQRPDLKSLHIVHRLDRLTSGIVIFAKNSVVARKLSTCIADREASKTYLARIKGHFPTEWTNESQQEMIAKAQAICKGSRLTFEANNTLLVSCPLRCLSQKDGVWECHEEGKESSTQIELIHLNKWTSLVRCKPITGRTHQIRLHLQLIGFPIANDPCYGGKLHYGESFEKKHSIAQTKEATKSVVDSQMSIDYMTPQRPDESEEEFMKRTCSWCKIGPEKAFNETQLHCSKIWLHALEYKLNGQVFQVHLPSWAKQDLEETNEDLSTKSTLQKL